MRRRPPLIVAIVAAIGLALFAIPLAGLLQQVDWADLGHDLRAPAATEALRLSLVTSLAATALAVVFGIPLAWVLARSDLPGRSLLRGLILLPMVLPPVVGGVALLSAFSLRSPLGGWLNDSFGIQFTFGRSGVILAETFVALPFLVLTVEAGLRSVDVRFEEVATGLGASPATTFRRVTLPLVAPSLVAGAVLAWARALGEFGATITFAGNVEGRTRTLPLAIYLDLLAGPDQRDSALAMSLVLLAVCFLVLVALRDRWSAGVSR